MVFHPPFLAAHFKEHTGQLADADATHRLGMELGRHLKKGDCVALVGEMGAGKTTLCRGLAQGFGVIHLDDVTSPTYALVNIYEATGAQLVHMDAWRLGGSTKAFALGLEEEVARDDALVVIEWADLLTFALPSNCIWLHLRDSIQGRTFTVWGPPAWLDRLEHGA